MQNWLSTIDFNVSNSFEFYLRPLGKFGSDRMDYNGRIGGMKKVGGNERTPHTVFVHHEVHMARAGIESGTPRARGDRSITERPRLQNSSHTLRNLLS